MQEELGLQIDRLCYAYGKKEALKAVSIALRAGRFTALLGPNGAGKSTLVSLLSGLFVPQSGSIRLFGVDVETDPHSALAVTGIVFQQQTLDLDLTVAQNMAYFAALHGLSGKAARLGIERRLALMGLDGRAGEKVRQLNGGHRRRLEIARVLLHQPRFLLLDEPTVGLDVPTRSGLVEAIHRLCRDEGLTVLWATHLVDEVEEDDDVVVLDRGEVRSQGPVAEVLEACGADDVLGAYHRLTAPDREEAPA